MPNVLVFESDSKFAGELKGELETRGCAVTVVDDAAVGLQTASVDKPDLILLAIELPRMNGFSVCNKLKRDPALKEVPLIIMSSDSTEETFEQHRRLRTHAEDYVHKPIAFVDLLPRISAQLPLPGDSPRRSVPPDNDIVIDEDIDFEDASSLPPPAPAPGNGAEAAPAPAGPVDEEVDAFTESAFGSMMDEPVAAPLAAPQTVEASVESAAPAPVASAPPPPGMDAPRHSQPPPLDFDPISLPSSVPPPPAPVPAAPVETAFAASVPPRPRMESVDQAIRDENAKLAEKARDLEKEIREARSRISELEDQAQRAASKDLEVQRLQRELDDVKAKAAAGGAARGGGSAREFLDLRETLNKKDKELLDLRDQITHKEKELLGLRDTNLGAERENADLSDRVAELEKQSSDAQRQLEGARADKEQAAKRADDFKRKSEKVQSELDARTAEAADLRQKLDEELAARAAREAAFETQLRETADRAEQVRDVAVAAAEERGLERGRTDAMAEAGRLLGEAAANSTKEREQAVMAREAELRQEHDARTGALIRANEDALGRLKAEHTQMLADEERAALARTQELEARLVQQHEVAIQQREAALNEQVAAHAAARSALADLSTLHDSLKEQKAQGENTRDRRIASLENDIVERTNELYSTQATLREREASLGTATATLASLGQELAELQTLLGHERARVERALSKWTEDRASLERAKDAMAAALSQMDEIESRGLE
jgi:CheY-like chemotaxis protein